MPERHLRPEDISRAREVVREGIAAGDADLAVMAVADSEGLIHLEAAAPDGREAEVRDDSIFLLASITKPFIGTAMAQLVQEGRLLFSDAAAHYVPEFRRYGKDAVTIWNLLTHTSGLAEEVAEPVWVRRGSPEEQLQAACEAFLTFPPGSAYRYCNLSFWVLAEIISRVSGLDYRDYVRERICAPLGMDDTGFVLDDEHRRRLLTVPMDAKTLGFTFEYFLSLGLPAGGICSTAADLVRFGQAMLAVAKGGRCPILSPAAARTITALQTAGIMEYETYRPARYGLGWAKPDAHAGSLGTDTGFGHGGATATLLWVEPDDDLVFVFLTNLWKDNRVARRALNAVLAAC